jgi:hypothetical protein
MRTRMDSIEKSRDAEWAKKHPERPTRCGSTKSGTTGSSAGGPRSFF